MADLQKIVDELSSLTVLEAADLAFPPLPPSRLPARLPPALPLLKKRPSSPSC